MPQLAKGGKYVFGWSKINPDLTIQLPPMAVDEYSISSENRVYLISGSKSTGGFCVTRKGLLYPSKIGNILSDTPALCAYRLAEGELIPYKGRRYCWLSISQKGILQFTDDIINSLSFCGIEKLLAIRSSDIAFTMGAKGPLVEFAARFSGVIDVF